MKASGPVLISLLLCVQAAAPSAAAQELVEYELTIAEELRAPAGRAVPALSLNGTSPGPVLRFREGDHARIRVRNTLKGEPTLVHWHGLLVPNAMDGVPMLTTPPIPPGGEHVYEFPLRQAGTYWYHSHVGFQEQRGVYGAIVIEPREPDIEVDRDLVVVLSDWTDEHPREVMRTLVRGSHWYPVKTGAAQSILGAWRAGALGHYFERERSRMPPMHLSDVGYDAFLANGEQQHHLEAEPGELVRLRVINAGASTYFHLSSGAGPLRVIAADGHPVQPLEVERLFMGMAETYDLLLSMPAGGEAVELRATAQDHSGHASVILGAGGGDPELLEAEDPPAPDLYRMAEMLEAGLESINHERGMAAQEAERPFAPYSLLEAVESTALVTSEEQEARVHKLSMRLTGDMRRYLWGFDGKTFAEDAVIHVSQGEVLRIEFINDTMMHHPLHLHGHFFRVLNGKGDRAPLKHTVDVPPMGRRTIEWIADEEPGDWLFHCHLLYHMMAGMTRVFSYREQGEDHVPALEPASMDPLRVFVDGALQNQHSSGELTARRARDDFLLRWDSGLGGEKEERELEIDLAWSRYIDPNNATLIGYRHTDDPEAEDRLFAGLVHMLPYLVESTLTLDSRGDLRIGLEKELQLTARLALFGELEYDTNTEEEWEAGLEWVLSKRFGLQAAYHSEHGTGAGIRFRL